MPTIDDNTQRLQHNILLLLYVLRYTRLTLMQHEASSHRPSESRRVALVILLWTLRLRMRLAHHLPSPQPGYPVPGLMFITESPLYALYSLSRRYRYLRLYSTSASSSQTTSTYPCTLSPLGVNLQLPPSTDCPHTMTA